MKNNNANSQHVIVGNANEFEKDLTFEVSKNYTITTKVTYKKGDVMESLIKQIRKLQQEVTVLKNNTLNISFGVLSELWDNKEDDKWNEY
ncbi:MAG: hypothetical protein NTX24_02720 [Candidatus Pacearchaeota archaeon]|nr:hypothetical protein [Candidatus Pacearchaeota archaeon]